MATLNEERQRLNEAVQEIRNILWQEWERTAIVRFLMRMLRIEE